MKSEKLILFVALLSTSPLGAATYDIGPGQAYNTIASFNWSTLQPGDTVRIHKNTLAIDGAYHEKLFVSKSGTSSQRIHITGVLEPDGSRPIIDGTNATTSGQFSFISTQWVQPLGLVMLNQADYVDVENLQIQYANSNPSAPNYFFDSSGAKREWDQGSGLYFLGGKGDTARNNLLIFNGNGMFVNSGNVLAQDVLVTGNDFYNNGREGSYGYHNSYCEAVNITYEYNHFGGTFAGGSSNRLKDRSGGNVIIRYNRFDGARGPGTEPLDSPDSGAHVLDLVEAEGAGEGGELNQHNFAFNKTQVYGNLILTSDNANSLIHFGDESSTPDYRRTLDFYDNTVVIHTYGNIWYAYIFNVVPGPKPNGPGFPVDQPYVINAANNIFYFLGESTYINDFFFMANAGTLNFTGPNYVSAQIGNITTTYNPNTTAVVNRNGLGISNAQNNPGFVDFAQRDFHLALGSQALGAGAPLDPNLPPVQYEYFDLSGIARGNINDLGCFQGPPTTPAAPTFTNHPQNLTVGIGASAAFSALATGNPTPSYQWQRNQVNIPGATGTTYTLPNAQLADSGAKFRCVATNSQGTATSNEATLMVMDLPPTITSQPQNKSVVVGQTAKFTITATGSLPLAYQWMKNGNDISGATAAFYTTPPTVLTDNGSIFACKVTNSAGNATSNNATLTVTNIPLTITRQPKNQTANPGDTATFSITATGNAPLTYQWQRNGVDLTYAIDKSYTTPALTAADNGTIFRCIVKDSVGTSLTSKDAALSITSTSGDPSVNNRRSDQILTPGTVASICLPTGHPADHLLVKIYDLTGTLVNQLEGDVAAESCLTWTGQNSEHSKVSSGVYLYRGEIRDTTTSQSASQAGGYSSGGGDGAIKGKIVVVK